MRRTVPVLLAALALTVLAACGGGSGGGSDSSDASTGPVSSDDVTAAASKLSSTTGVHVVIHTDSVPQDKGGLLDFDGDLAANSDFEGSAIFQYPSLGATKVPVIGVGGQVYAQLPLTSGYTLMAKSDLAGLGVPDLTVLWTSVGDIISSATGTPADRSKAVVNLLPGAEGDFDVTYEVKDGTWTKSVITGHFFGADKGTSTYTIEMSDYGITPTVKAPSATP